jgi:type I restriction enzyme S subunit
LLVPQFLMSYLNSQYAKSQFFKMAKATTGINTINMSQLKSLKIPCPPITYQKDFGQIAHILINVREEQKTSKVEISNFLNSLMSKKLNGEINC